MKNLHIVLFALVSLLPISVAADNVATLRDLQDTTATPVSPRMPVMENLDLRRERNYPMQPPTIPHKIDAYQVDLKTNKCLSCHHRRRVSDSQAPMVSVTHYMDRDGNFLAEVSPRRYFCQQCHVPQSNAKPLVGNRFIPVDALIKAKQGSDNHD